MTITLNEIPGWQHRSQAALAVVAIAITALVYGVVGLIAGDGRCRCACVECKYRIGRGIGKGLRGCIY
jgi:predicted DNA repair protein MutK